MEIEAMDIFEMQAEAEKLGYWMELKSPFAPGDRWFAGFTAQNCSGWNGRPDVQGAGHSGQEAVCDAFRKLLNGVELSD